VLYDDVKYLFADVVARVLEAVDDSEDESAALVVLPLQVSAAHKPRKLVLASFWASLN
jgi:hypothetical protein